MRKYICLLILLLCVECLLAQSAEFRGQLSSWIFFRESEFSESQFGIRYLPTLFLEKSINDNTMLDSDLSMNSFGVGTFNTPDLIVDESKAKLYRLWLRLSGSQFEVRAGLQKINFGSATILRPLMWFDRLDPRDPLRLTEGVYGLLGRYYFLNNANVWLWGLYGNDETKGWEVIPTDAQSIEYGGRVQYPIGSGEIALTYDHRKADFGNSLLSQVNSDSSLVPENRIAFSLLIPNMPTTPSPHSLLCFLQGRSCWREMLQDSWAF